MSAVGGLSGSGPISAEAMKLYRILKTVCKMLDKRGYVVDKDRMDMTPDKFVELYSNTPDSKSMSFLAIRPGGVDGIFVYFPVGDVGVAQCKPFIELMREHACSRGVLVVGGRFSSTSKSILTSDPGLHIETFRQEELLIDITEHDLVPTHVVLSEEEKAALLDRYKLKETQLPRILTADPVARYFGLVRGQVVKIIRPSETAGRYVTYRIAV